MFVMLLAATALQIAEKKDYVVLMVLNVLQQKKGVHNLKSAWKKDYVDLMENNVWPPMKDAQSPSNVLQRGSVHIYRAPKTMNLLMEHVSGAVPDAKNQYRVRKMVFVGFPTGFVSPIHKDVRTQRSAVQAISARTGHL